MSTISKPNGEGFCSVGYDKEIIGTIKKIKNREYSYKSIDGETKGTAPKNLSVKALVTYHRSK